MKDASFSLPISLCVCLCLYLSVCLSLYKIMNGRKKVLQEEVKRHENATSTFYLKVFIEKNSLGRGQKKKKMVPYKTPLPC